MHDITWSRIDSGHSIPDWMNVLLLLPIIRSDGRVLLIKRRLAMDSLLRVEKREHCKSSRVLIVLASQCHLNNYSSLLLTLLCISRNADKAKAACLVS